MVKRIVKLFYIYGSIFRYNFYDNG